MGNRPGPRPLKSKTPQATKGPPAGKSNPKVRASLRIRGLAQLRLWLGPQLPLRLRLRRMAAVALVALLLGQATMAVTGLYRTAQGQGVPTVADTDYGVSLALQELNAKMEGLKASPTPAIKENLSYYGNIYADRTENPTQFATLEAEAATRDEQALVEASTPMDLAGEFESYTKPLNHQGYSVEQVEPIPSVQAEIFDWILTNASVANVSLFETITSLLTDTYLIYTKYNGYQNVTSANLIDTLAGASIGLLTQFVSDNVIEPLRTALLFFLATLDQSAISWVEINVDADPEDDLRVRLVPVIRDITNSSIGLSEVVLNTQAGLSIQVQEINGELAEPIDVAVLRAIGYPGEGGVDQTYIWTVLHTFSELPDNYLWEILAEDITFTLSGTSLLGPGNFTSFDPPYTVQFKINDGDGDTIDRLTMLPGYAKFVWYQGLSPEEALDDITFVNATFYNPDPQIKIPGEVIMRIKGDDVGESRYDAIEWYATADAHPDPLKARPNVDVTYYEMKENPADTNPFHSYILAQIEGLPVGDLGNPDHPQTSLFLEIKNESSDSRPKWTVVDLQATSPLPAMKYWDFEYYSENRSRPATFENHDYQRYLYLEVHNIPARLHLEGTFWLTGSGDPITLFDTSPDLVGNFINNLLLRVASKLYAIGLTLRGLPEAVLGVSAAGGRFLITLRNRNDQPAHLGSAFFYFTSDRYLAYPGQDDFFAIFNETAYLAENAVDNRSAQSDNNTGLAVSGRLSGIGDVSYQSEGVYRNVSLSTAADRDKPFRFFLQNTDAGLKPTDWANITLSDLPDHIILNITADTFAYQALAGSGEGEVISNITFRAFANFTYTAFDLDHLPSRLSLTRTPTILYLDTYGEENYFDFSFAISNFSDAEKVTLYRWSPEYNGSYALLYQRDVTLATERTAVAGRLLGLSSIRLETLDEQSRFTWRLRDSVPFRVGVYDPTDYQDPTLGLNGYVEVAALPRDITVTIPPVDATSIPETQVGNVSSLSDIARLVTQVAALGNTLVGLVSDMSLNLVSGVGAFKTGAQFDYNLGQQSLDLVGWVHKGDVDQLDDPRWVHGLWAREKELAQGNIMSARFLLRGLPPRIGMNFTSEGDHVTVDLNFKNLEPWDNGTTRLDYLLLDIRGVRGLNATFYLPHLPSGLDLNATVDLVANTTAENLTLKGNVSFEANRILGPLYLMISESQESSYLAKLVVSNLPYKVDLGLDISDNASLSFDGHGGIVNLILAQVEVGDTTNLTSYWVHGLSVEVDEVNRALSAKVYLEGLPSYASLELTRGVEGTRLDLTAKQFHSVPAAPDYLILDIRNLSNLDILLYLEELPTPVDLSVNLWLHSGLEGSRNLSAELNLTLSEPLAAAYVRVVERSEVPVLLEAVVPNVPTGLLLTVSISETVALDFVTPEGEGGLEWALVAIDIGDTSGLEAYWTHGLVIRQGQALDYEPLAVRLYLTGLPSRAHLDADFSRKALIHLLLENFSPAPYPWAVVDVEGFGNSSFLLFVSYIPQGTSLNATFDIDADETYWVKDRFDIRNDRQLGATYLKTFNYTKPGTTEVYLSHVPANLKADLYSGRRVDLTISGDDPGYLVWINLAKKTHGKWRTIHATVHDTPTYFRFVIEPSYRFDMHQPFIFQGFPSIEVYTASNDIDVYLNIDPGYTGGYTGSRLHAIDVGNNSKFQVRYRGDTPLFVIDAPNLVGQAFYRVDGAPSTKQFYLEYLEIHARQVRYVSIEAKLVFGAYPIFVLENAQGGELAFGISGTLTLLGQDLEVNALLLDVRMKEVAGQPLLPSWTSAQFNGATTELGDNSRHYIIPEPISSLLGSLGGSLFG